jgi:CHAT domain-containing protein
MRLDGKIKLQARVSNYLTSLKQKRAAREQAADLFKTLMGALSEYSNAHRLIIVPDGNLHLLPFDALIDGAQKYVVESKTVLYVPSSTSFYLLKSGARIPADVNGLLAVGAVPYGSLRRVALTRGYSDSPWELPASGPEVMAAAAQLHKFKNTLLMNSEATEAAFKKESSRPYRFIHLAVHAFPDDDPDRAALMMLSDPLHGEDGFLQASEIVQLRLEASLVVLSACETGVGPIEGQEGIATLSTSFLLAGAHNVVSTLWPIEDEPSLFLMTHFYRQLSRNLPPADSMATAKREMLQTFGPESLPFYWAGFIVEGSDSL